MDRKEYLKDLVDYYYLHLKNKNTKGWLLNISSNIECLILQEIQKCRKELLTLEASDLEDMVTVQLGASVLDIMN